MTDVARSAEEQDDAAGAVRYATGLMANTLAVASPYHAPFIQRHMTALAALLASRAVEAERLRALVDKWRSEADRSKLLQGLSCADDLAALLANHR